VSHQQRCLVQYQLLAVPYQLLAVLHQLLVVTSNTVPVTSSEHAFTTSGLTPPAHHTTTTAPDTSTPTVVTSATVTPVTHHAVAEISSSKVKLPKLELKKFNGDLTKWETFWSSFESSIHINTSLTWISFST